MHSDLLFCINRLSFGPKASWLNPSGQFDILSKKESCYAFLFGNIPTYKEITVSEINDSPLFPSDAAELQRQRNIMPAETLTYSWLVKMREEDNAIREKAALFWHHHIPCTMRDVTSGKQLLEIYRKHSLGKLRDLLKELIVNKSVLYFLTGRRSDKANPNENFARELLELYTLGIGNYEQKDIIEIARAFTGIAPDENGNGYSIIPDLYDASAKTIFGKTGNFDRFDVIDIILERKETAKHICKEALTFYGNANPLESHVEACAELYRNSDYSFIDLLQFIFTSDWFYSTPQYRNKVKTPVELFIGFQRQAGFRLIGVKAHWKVMSALGQELFRPHSVAGWSEGSKWLQGKNILNRKFLLRALLDIANRPFERSSTPYKLYSRIFHPHLREFRYTVDGSFDERILQKRLVERNISLQAWMLGLPEEHDESTYSLAQILSSDYYQYI